MMTETDFFKTITAGASTKEEEIIRILQARGFLIFSKDGAHYLSDNATQGDIAYLAKGFEGYFLGEVVPVQRKDALAKLFISADAKVRDAIAFFNKNSFVSFPITDQRQPWGKLKTHVYGEKVDVENLEPYVARYVKAVSACGVATNFSCDGNHEGQSSIKINATYPFNILHRVICERIIPSKNIKFEEQLRVEFTPRSRFEKYLFLNQAAAFLYDHRFEIRDIKAKACKTITASQIKHLPDSELESLFIASLIRVWESNPVCRKGE